MSILIQQSRNCLFCDFSDHKWTFQQNGTLIFLKILLSKQSVQTSLFATVLIYWLTE